MSLRDSFWFRRSKLLCQFAPQFLCNGTHDLALEPLTHAALISPLPPTLEIMTRLKFDCPLRVKRTPPLLVHDTLQFMYFLLNPKLNLEGQGRQPPAATDQPPTDQPPATSRSRQPPSHHRSTAAFTPGTVDFRILNLCINRVLSYVYLCGEN